MRKRAKRSRIRSARRKGLRYSKLNPGSVKRLRIALGATARNPEDVLRLHDLRLEFAEIAIEDLNNFKKKINKFLELKEKTRLYIFVMGLKREILIICRHQVL